MRGFDRDPIRGKHYGQRSCEPHPKAEHMAAPTKAATCENPLTAWSRSTHGPLGEWPLRFSTSAYWGAAAVDTTGRRELILSIYGGWVWAIVLHGRDAW
jgi:hypothetical protein